MSWDRGRYYSRSKRVDGRIVRQYIGCGLLAGPPLMPTREDVSLPSGSERHDRPGRVGLRSPLGPSVVLVRIAQGCCRKPSEEPRLPSSQAGRMEKEATCRVKKSPVRIWARP